MTIADTREKCKALVAQIPRDILIIGVLILASSASFGLGYLAGLDAGQGSDTLVMTPLTATSSDTTSAEATKGTAGQFVASKSGTKYYLPSCAGANRISEGNKVWFASAADAVAAGYSPAANCNGI